MRPDPSRSSPREQGNRLWPADNQQDLRRRLCSRGGAEDAEVSRSGRTCQAATLLLAGSPLADTRRFLEAKHLCALRASARTPFLSLCELRRQSAPDREPFHMRLPCPGPGRGRIFNVARGSVSRVLSTARKRMGDHSSRTTLARRLKRPTRTASRNEAHVPSLFGLAPGGVCRAAPVAGRAVRSCRTVSPLPCRSTGGVFSVALSLTRLAPNRRALPGTVVPWSPDFPRPRP